MIDLCFTLFVTALFDEQELILIHIISACCMLAWVLRTCDWSIYKTCNQCNKEED